MSQLHTSVDEYLAVRRALGYKLEEHGRLLPDFIDYLERIGACAVTIEAALVWATRPQGVQPFRWKQRLSVVRGFARWLQPIDPVTQVPPADLLAYRRERPTPYLFSATEIARLVAATDTLRRPLRALTHRTLFGLVAATGIRAGEALRLDRDDLDLDAGLLTIRQTKFNKSRQLPLLSCTVAALCDYAEQRDRLCPQPKALSFFVSTVGSRLGGRRVRQVFADLVDQIGLQPRDGSRRPRMHDLRHSFAVATLIGWYRDGGDVAARMPLLSAYLGHASPASTYWYLQACPPLLALAAKRLEQPQAGQP
jgi:integrase